MLNNTDNMPRPPLCELPLEPFLVPESKSSVQTLSPVKASSKRTLSPIAPSLYSSTKRRVLNEEGVLYADKSQKDLFIIPVRANTSRFVDALYAQSRKLEFETSKLSTVEEKHATSPMSLLAPSPEITPRSTNRLSSSAIPTSFQAALDMVDFYASSPCSATITPAPILIPRDHLPQPDRQSIHYPGFDIHQDNGVVAPRAKASSAEVLTPLDAASESKENIPPPRVKLRKAVPTSDSGGVKRASPSKARVCGSGQVEPGFTLATTGNKPRFGVADWDLDVPQTPRRPSRARHMENLTELSLSPFQLHSPGKTPAATRLQRMEARRTLLDEANDFGIEDDDDEDFGSCL